MVSAIRKSHADHSLQVYVKHLMFSIFGWLKIGQVTNGKTNKMSFKHQLS